MTTDKPDSDCFNMAVPRDIVGTNSTTDRHYDCPTTEIVPKGGGGARDGLRDDGHGFQASEGVAGQQTPRMTHLDGDEAVCGDLDAVIEGLAEAGEREEAERLRKVTICEYTNCTATRTCFHYCHEHHEQVCQPPAYADDAGERQAWHDRYPEARAVIEERLPSKRPRRPRQPPSIHAKTEALVLDALQRGGSDWLNVHGSYLGYILALVAKGQIEQRFVDGQIQARFTGEGIRP